jgi:hypothetical protein
MNMKASLVIILFLTIKVIECLPLSGNNDLTYRVNDINEHHQWNQANVNSKRSPRQFSVKYKRHHSSESHEEAHNQILETDFSKRSPRRFSVEYKRGHYYSEFPEEVLNQDQEMYKNHVTK